MLKQNILEQKYYFSYLIPKTGGVHVAERQTYAICFIHTGHQRVASRGNSTYTSQVRELMLQEIPNMGKDQAGTPVLKVKPKCLDRPQAV